MQYCIDISPHCHTLGSDTDIINPNFMRKFPFVIVNMLFLYILTLITYLIRKNTRQKSYFKVRGNLALQKFHYVCDIKIVYLYIHYI